MMKKVIASKLFKTLLFTIVLAIGFAALAEEGGAEHAEHAEGIPRVVVYQFINFFGLMAILYFALKNRVRDFFTKRHDNLTSAIREARRAKEEAETRHQEYVVKIQNLEREASAYLDQIKREAEDSKRRIIEEAKKLAENVRREAARAAENEAEKAKAELHDEVITQALDGARKILSQSVAENDQRRLQKEFVEKIEAVQ
jgi:F-type H+-transporting ATPase subunit b